MTYAEFYAHMRRHGWVDHDDLLTHAAYPDLHYIVYPFFGVFEQRRHKSGTWWCGVGWSWDHLYIGNDGRFYRT